MKSKFSLLGGVACALTCAVAFTLAPSTSQAAPAKVRISVKENIGHAPATPKEDKPDKTKPTTDKNGVKASTPPSKDKTAAKDDMYTHSSTHSLTVTVTNATQENLDLTVKSTFIGKDETGKHEVGPDKTVETKFTLEPGKSHDFTTEEVVFTHTSAHRKVAAGKGAKPENIPASGKQYEGYKVEAYSGNDLVGSESHGGSSF